jgi:hypothetical protein
MTGKTHGAAQNKMTFHLGRSAGGVFDVTVHHVTIVMARTVQSTAYTLCESAKTGGKGKGKPYLNGQLRNEAVNCAKS